ncbi:MAG TPA: ankyrin repeat domain-containing protein, partial [Candidatus Ozemobacteraceae bacterium]|nr:ankyrin repeat domain-containing protein [Candidatus Ozemobacteraceae bacterium]
LVEKGAPVSGTDDLGRTPLHRAASSGHLSILELLVSHKANILSTDAFGNTPLHLAAAAGNDACVKFLLAAGADPSLKAADGMTPEDKASASGHVLSSFLPLPDRPVPILAGQAKEPRMKSRSAKNAVVGNRGKDSRSSSKKRRSSATAAGNIDEPSVFSAVSNFFYSFFLPTHQFFEAISKSDAESVESMLANFPQLVNVQNKEKFNETPLHLAARIANPRIVRLLLSCDADIEAKTIDGWTPLHKAAFWGHLEIVKMLVENNAALTPVDDLGETPHDKAVSRGHDQIIDWLGNRMLEL